MHQEILKNRYTIKAFENKGNRPVEISHPLTEEALAVAFHPSGFHVIVSI